MENSSNKKFENGKIYFIGNYIDDDIYIGSSCQPLNKRFQNHKDSINTYKKNRKLYVKMRELGTEHFFIEEIEKCPCNSLQELRKRERYYIIERKPTLNKEIPTRTKAEWTMDNRERKREMDRKYYLKTKEIHNQKSKEYRENNPEKMKEYKQKWYENKRDDLSKKSKERIICECGVEVCQGAYTRHLKSKTHQNYLNNNIDNVQVSQEEQENRDEGSSP